MAVMLKMDLLAIGYIKEFVGNQEHCQIYNYRHVAVKLVHLHPGGCTQCPWILKVTHLT